jgi:hypothetical protein
VPGAEEEESDLKVRGEGLRPSSAAVACASSPGPESLLIRMAVACASSPEAEAVLVPMAVACASSPEAEAVLSTCTICVPRENMDDSCLLADISAV